jgi:NAD(P)H-dependent FMN reductase
MTSEHTTPLRLAVITASVREGRFAPVVTDWITARAADHGRFTVDPVDLADHPLPLALPAVSPAIDPDPERPAAMAGLTARLRDADAFIVVTPDYNRSFPASVKAAIDWHYTEWQHKAIGFVGLGAPPGRSLGEEPAAACWPSSSCGRSSTNCTPTPSVTTSPSRATTRCSRRTAP